ncbi:ribonuclease HII [Orrella sp. JC864]|uniref:ribonuclease HII n=1 Tax=Orrella sp. JC864 TaxID=3120298 RepID=UPI0012BC8CE4
MQAELFAAPVLTHIAGVDEAGRGPLAGAVYAGAVILPKRARIRGLADSKVLTPERRQELAVAIRAKALAWAVASASVEEIDRLNILQATFLAMRRAVQALAQAPDLALVDGNQAPSLPCMVRTVIKGDATEPAISAASILAKTERDADLLRLHGLYPQYGFDQHKGYATALHLQRLREHGPCPAHRTSFAPVRAMLGLPAAPVPPIAPPAQAGELLPAWDEAAHGQDAA